MKTAIGHAQLRAVERYGLVLDKDDLTTLANDLRFCRGLHLVSDSVGFDGYLYEIWDIEVKGTLCRVVYSPETRFVITFLPRPKGAWYSPRRY